MESKQEYLELLERKQDGKNDTNKTIIDYIQFIGIENTMIMIEVIMRI